jgi:molybdopterin molybdotransferase
VALLSTGDELCRWDEAPAEGRLVDTNGPTLALAVLRAGGLPTQLGICRDDLADIERGLTQAQDFDVVLTTAGVSVGERDWVKDAMERRGVERILWRVAMKPGKPLVVGRRGQTLYFGLPGNPTSALVCFELFVRPCLRRLLGHPPAGPPRVGGRAASPFRKAAGLTHFVRVQATYRDGSLWARPLATQTSGALRSAAHATHLMEIPADVTEVSEGSPVGLIPLSWGQE